ncbi:MAG: hypothetical protein J6N81_01980 [Treponema sp.]|nr:hypothetical protein [Treponema sp.]
MLKRLISVCVIFSLFIPVFSQKKNTSGAGKSPTTTKSLEAKNAVDELKKNPNPKKEIVIVYNEDFEKGEELFQLNKPEEAISYFEKALSVGDVNPNVYVYLGVCYYQIEQYDKSLTVCVQGMAKEGTDKKVLAYNAGNACYAMGNYMRADASYALALREDDSYAPAILNRANAQLKLDHLADARDNYIRYLELESETPQKERIESIISLLDEEIERRANEKPELINPDAIVENEKMEIPESLEKVALELPDEEEKIQETHSELVKDEAKAPLLPVTPAKKDEVEKITDNSLDSLESEEKSVAEVEKTPAEKIDTPELMAASQEPVPPAHVKDEKNPLKSELVYDSEEQARFEEEQKLALEAEKVRIAEEAEKKAESESARLAAEEAERRRNDDMRLILEVEKTRLEEEYKKALEVERERLAENAKKSLELEKALLEVEAAKKALDAEKARLEEERKALEAERSRLQENAR